MVQVLKHVDNMIMQEDNCVRFIHGLNRYFDRFVQYLDVYSSFVRDTEIKISYKISLLDRFDQV